MKPNNFFPYPAAALLGAVLLPLSSFAADVKVTPLGSQEGEFCQLDRAMIFEDPDGTRILYDAGRTVAGPDDPRLGKIDAVLVSHMHGDHVGDRHILEPGDGSCGDSAFPESALPTTNTVAIANAKGAKIVTGSEMPKFFAAKLDSIGGNPKDSQLVRFGASTRVGGVTITTVPAVHSNGISGAMIGGDLGNLLNAAGLTAYAGPPTGYVLTFSNGLPVRRYRRNRRTENRGKRPLRGEARGDQYRRHLYYRARRSRLGYERAGQARVGDSVACQPAFHPERQGHRRYSRRAILEGGQGKGPPAFERTHDVLQRQGQVQRRLLERMIRRLNAAGVSPSAKASRAVGYRPPNHSIGSVSLALASRPAITVYAA